MATVKLKFRPSPKKSNEGTIYYQLNIKCVVRRIKTKYKLYSNEWNIAKSNIINSNSSVRRSLYLSNIQNRIKADLRRLELIVKFNEYQNIDVIVAAFSKSHKGCTLFDFAQDVISRYNELGKIRTAETYASTLNSFMIYRHGYDIALSQINSDLLEGYEAFLLHKNSSLNTVSFYMRRLRAIYNRAIDREIIPQQNPFKRVYTSIEKTTKRAISIKQISRIKELDLTHHPTLEFVRDVFMFSFYTRGMSFVDIAYLRKIDIRNGVLSYTRRKTKQRLEIRWERCMADIVAKYPNNSTEYLLPIITNLERHPREQYISSMRRVNIHLKKIMQLAKIDCNLTMYVARHSWASAARSKNIPISVISEGLGHDSEATTQIYLASLENQVIDRANKLILNSI